MFISETYFHLDQPVEVIEEIRKAFTDLAELINTPADIEYFMGLQESFSPTINAGIEDCVIMIMPADILANAVSAHGGAILAYSRNAMTGTPIIMVSREAMRELDAKAMEALVFHELVHKDQDERGDLSITFEGIDWKGEVSPLIEVSQRMQDAMAQYEDLEPTEASLLAICETMPWELEAYAKSYEYAQTTGADTTWSPSIMERVIALYHRVMA